MDGLGRAMEAYEPAQHAYYVIEIDFLIALHI